MRFIFNTANTITDKILQIRNQDEELIESVLLFYSKQLVYIEDIPDAKEYHLSLHSIENREREIETMKRAIPLQESSRIKRIVYEGKIEEQASYKDAWESETDYDDKVKFLDWTGEGDALNFDYAYQTILKNIDENVRELFFAFTSLPGSSCTILQAVGQRYDVDCEISLTICNQFFKRIPSCKVLEEHYIGEKQRALKKWKIAVFAVIVLYILNILIYFLLKPSLIMCIVFIIIGLIVMEWFNLGKESVEMTYQMMLENELITSEKFREMLAEHNYKDDEYENNN